MEMDVDWKNAELIFLATGYWKCRLQIRTHKKETESCAGNKYDCGRIRIGKCKMYKGREKGSWEVSRAWEVN